MIENILNRLASTALDCVRWTVGDNGPDTYDLSFANFISGEQTFYSRPIAIQGMELTTFQAVYIPDTTGDHSDVSFRLHFQSSQDGYHWDDIPDDSFTTDISTIFLSYDKLSETYEVLVNSSWIRVLITAETEGGGLPLDSAKIYITTKEN